jgi:glutamyl-tRNA synthetase
LLRGDITVQNTTLDDFVIIKSDGTSLYHLAAMVDDHLMDITHVIRSAEWLPSLPKHALIYRAFSWPEPVWVHLSVFLKPSGKGKMSKRDVTEGHSILVKDLPGLGYLPEAVLNWIVLMGWSLDDKTEFFNLEDMVKGFDLNRLNPSPAAVNFEKFDHFNGLHIRALPDGELARRLGPFFEQAGLPSDETTLLRLVPLIHERLTTLDEAPEKVAFLFQAEVTYDRALLIPKGMEAATALDALRRSIALLRALPDLNHAASEPPLRALADELGLKPGQLFGILRVAVTGQTVSPPLFETMAVMDRETVFGRLEKAESLLTNT